jgi:hypothetical protein
VWADAAPLRVEHVRARVRCRAGLHRRLLPVARAPVCVGRRELQARFDRWPSESSSVADVFRTFAPILMVSREARLARRY